MTIEQKNPVRLERPISRRNPWAYLVIGAVLGVFFEVAVCEPLGEWPGLSVTGILYGMALGYVFYRLKEQRQRVQTLHREFELQVATLRHRYKNLSVGISGFVGRIKRKLEAVPNSEILEKDVAILEDASQRLSHTLGEELLFLRALTSDTLTPVPQDIYPFLKHAVTDLLGLRFSEKDLNVEINGLPLEAEQPPLVFSFEPYTMEAILQNILSNAMQYGNHVRVNVASPGSWVRVEVSDNGPGLEVEKLQHHLLTPKDKSADSTHLGLEVTMHLLEKTGGRLLAWSEPGAGATFAIEFPK